MFFFLFFSLLSSFVFNFLNQNDKGKKKTMVANVLILSSLVVVCQGAGLVDNPIAADVVKYIDSTVVEAKWVATAHTPLPRPRPPPPSNNCVFEKGVDWAGAHNTSSGTAVSGVTSKEDCCSICAADSSCFVAVWTGEDQVST